MQLGARRKTATEGRVQAPDAGRVLATMLQSLQLELAIAKQGIWWCGMSEQTTLMS